MMYVGMTAFRRVRRVLANLVVRGIVVLAPAAARAATVQTDLPCYLENRSVAVTGTGFTPGGSFSVLRAVRAIGGGTVGPDGSVTGAFASGPLETGIAERAFDLTLTDGTN